MYSCIQRNLGIGTHLQTWISSVAVTTASMARTAVVCTASEARKFGKSMNCLRICCSSLQRFATQVEHVLHVWCVSVQHTFACEADKCIFCTNRSALPIFAVRLRDLPQQSMTRGAHAIVISILHGISQHLPRPFLSEACLSLLVRFCRPGALHIQQSVGASVCIQVLHPRALSMHCVH